MDELVQFLRARYAEEAEAARAAADRESDWWWGPDAETAAERHIARHDPARVLRDIEAKRQLVGVHHAELIEVVNADREERSGYWCAECDGETFPCRTLRLLASVYADHPGYRVEWRP